MDCSTPGLPVHHQPPGLLKLMSDLMGREMCCVGSSHHRPCNLLCFVATLTGQALEHILLVFILLSLWGKRNLPTSPSGLSSLFTGSHTCLLFFSFAGEVSSMPQSYPAPNQKSQWGILFLRRTVFIFKNMFDLFLGDKTYYRESCMLHTGCKLICSVVVVVLRAFFFFTFFYYDNFYFYFFGHASWHARC